MATPSIQHEGLVRVFRDRDSLAPALVGMLAGEPGWEAVEGVETARVTSSVPTAPGARRFDMDLVVVVDRAGQPREAVLVEVQRSAEHTKRDKWPLALPSVREELGCPAALLVVATTERVAQWARRPIEVGHPGYQLRPLVLGPGNLQQSEVELALGSAYEMELAALRGLVQARRSSEASWAGVLRTLVQLNRFDDPRAPRYITLVLEALPAARRVKLEEDMTEGRLPELSEVERRIGQRAKLAGQREILLRLLRARFGELDEAIVGRVEQATEEQIERWAERMVADTPNTPEDVLA